MMQDVDEVKRATNQHQRANAREKEQYVRLTELGPRITMNLVKIEEKVNTGKVLYHRFITKTKQEEWTAEQTKLEKEKEKELQRKERNSDRRLKRMMEGFEQEGNAMDVTNTKAFKKAADSIDRTALWSKRNKRRGG